VLPLSLLGGAGFLVLADTLARTVLSPAELPIGVVTALVGSPVFVWILRTTRSRSGHERDRDRPGRRGPGPHVPVLRGVSCAVSSGGWLALIGPNGAGKTTLLRAMAGLLPYRGTITLGRDGSRRAARPASRARRIAYVPQIPVLPPDMTVADYVLLGRTPYLGYLAAPGPRGPGAAAEAPSGSTSPASPPGG
jgi:hypothetical protein